MRIQRILLALVLAAVAVAPSVAAAQRTGRAIQIVRRGWLGISYEAKAEIIDGRTTESQITVQDVIEGSPADKAGVRVGDQIVRIDGKAVNAGKFESLARAMEPGDTMRLRLLSNGREREVTVVATDRPAQYAITPNLRLFRGDSGFIHFDSVRAKMRIFMDSARFGEHRLFGDSIFLRSFPRGGMWFDSIGGNRFLFRDSLPGLYRFEMSPLRGDWIEGMPKFDLLINRGGGIAGAEFTELNPGLAHYFGTDEGLLVLRVGPGTPAALAGLEPGDVVTRANGRVVEDVEDFRVTVARARDANIKIDVLRKGKPRSLDLDVKRRRD